jgi:hypothetical protein
MSLKSRVIAQATIAGSGGWAEIEGGRPPKVGAIFENAGRSLGEVAADIGVIVRAGARCNNKAGFAVARGLFNAEAAEDCFRSGRRNACWRR